MDRALVPHDADQQQYQVAQSVGNILLEAQRELRRARDELTSSTGHGYAGALPPIAGALSSEDADDPQVSLPMSRLQHLSNILEQTESRLRERALDMLNVVDSSERPRTIPTLPAVRSAVAQEDAGQLSLTNAFDERRLAHPVSSAQSGPRYMLSRSQPTRHSQSLEQLTDDAPSSYVIIGGKKNNDSSRVGRRPLGRRYVRSSSCAHSSEETSHSRQGGKLRRSGVSQARVLPRHVRKDPATYPLHQAPVTVAHATAASGMGVYEMINRGLISKSSPVADALMGGVGLLNSGPPHLQTSGDDEAYIDNMFITSSAPLQGQSLRMRAYKEQFRGQSIADAPLVKSQSFKENRQPQSSSLVVAGDLQDGYTHDSDSRGLVPSWDPEASASTTTSRAVAAVAAKTLELGGELVAVSSSAAQQPEHRAMEEHRQQGRDYDQLMDKFSLHRVLIRRGTVLDSTPEFASFRRTHAAVWDCILVVLRLLENICLQLRLDVAHVDGSKVVQLAVEMDKMEVLLGPSTRISLQSTGNNSRKKRPEPSTLELVSCLEHVDHAALLSRLPGHRFGGPGGSEMACTIIQATWRMHVARDRYGKLKIKHAAAKHIQNVFQNYMVLKRTREDILESWNQRLSEWEKIQADFKSNWQSLSQRNHVAIHIPSLSVSTSERLATHNLGVKQNLQIPRICDLAVPHRDVVYVCPFTLPADVQAYYSKLLQLGNIKASDTASRLRLLVPESIDDALDEQLSLASRVYYSPKIVQQIKKFVRGRPAYIVPGVCGDEDLRLAVHLGLPLMAPTPDVASVFGTKSGSKRIFADAQIPTPVGAHDIFDISDFYAYLAMLIVRYMEVPRWIFKTDDSRQGRGVAYFDVSVLNAYQQMALQCSDHPKDTELDHTVADQYARIIERALRAHLPHHVVLAYPNLYNNSWSKFAQAFLSIGGVIEACPETIVSSPAVNLFIEPDGSVNITSTHDQLFVAPCVKVGEVFPSSTHHATLVQAAKRIGQACIREGIIGAVRVEFLVYLDTVPDTSEDAADGAVTTQYRMWGVDLKLGTTTSHSSQQLFDFLMGERGRYLPDLRGGGRYVIESERKNSSTAAAAADSQRFMVSLPYLFHPALATAQLGRFFQLCRLQGVSFDLKTRSGTAFVLLDSLACGSLGLLSVGETAAHALQHASTVCTFLHTTLGSTRSVLGGLLPAFDTHFTMSDVTLSVKNAWKAQSDKETAAKRSELLQS